MINDLWSAKQDTYKIKSIKQNLLKVIKKAFNKLK